MAAMPFPARNVLEDITLYVYDIFQDKRSAVPA
jgi:hypothetical protein